MVSSTGLAETSLISDPGLIYVNVFRPDGFMMDNRMKAFLTYHSRT